RSFRFGRRQTGLDHGRGRVGPPEGRPHPLHPPAFLVEENRSVQAADAIAKRTRQFAELLTVADIAFEQDEAPGSALTKKSQLLQLEPLPLTAADERPRHRDLHRAD